MDPPENETERYTTFAAFPQSCPVAPSKLSAAGFHYEGNEDEVLCHSCGLKYKNWQRGDNPLTLHQLRSPGCNFVCTRHEISTGEEISQSSDDGSSEIANAGFFAGVYVDTSGNARCHHLGLGLREWTDDADTIIKHARWFPQAQISLTIQSGPERTENKTNNLADTKDRDSIRSGKKDKNLFDHPAVLSLLQMGYSKRMVKKAITKSQKHNKMDFDAASLLSIIFEIEDIYDQGDTTLPEDEITELGDTDDESSCGEQFTNIPENAEELFNHRAVQAVSMLGYTKEEILKAIDLLKSKLRAKFTATEIMECLFEIEKEAEERKKKDEEIQRLQQENQALQNMTICKVCLDEKASMVFLPCGHLTTCQKCSSALGKCPICRKDIRGTVRAFLT